MAHFSIGKTYSRVQINNELGCGSLQAYMITRKNKVLAACVDPVLNPKAPEELYAGVGKVIEANVTNALLQNESFHMFLKRDEKAYEYIGRYEAYAMSTLAKEIEEAELLSERKDVAPISRILRLRKPEPR